MNFHRLYKNIFLRSAFVVALAFSFCACAASPPAGIPAPVSQLLSVSNPDDSGTVTVTGQAAAVNGGAQVTAANVSQGGMVQKLQELLIRVAHAQSAPIEATVTAGPDGSFTILLSANIGDVIRIVQEVNGERSQSTEVIVGGNTVLLQPPPRGIATDPNGGTSLITASDGQNGLVYLLNFLTNSPIASLPVPFIGFPGFVGITKVIFNPLINRGTVISPTENELISFNTQGAPNSNTTVLGASPLDIDLVPDGDLAAIGLRGAGNAVDIYDTFTDSVICNFSTEAGFNDIETPLVSLSQDSIDDFVLLAVSLLDNGSYILTRWTFSDCMSSFQGPFTTPLPNGIDPRGLAPFAFSSKALITNAAAGVVHQVDFLQGLQGDIPVGNSPQAVAVNGSDNRAYVINGGDNSLSIIDLFDFSVITQEGVGLVPFEINLLNGTRQGILLTAIDGAAALVDLAN